LDEGVRAALYRRAMKFSRLTERIAGEGARAWAVHFEAMRRRRAGEDIIVLSVGDPDFDTPPAIVAAAKTSLDRGRTHYTEIVGDLALRTAIARRRQAHTGQRTGPENVVVAAGAQCALFATALCLLDFGDELIVPEPMYLTYEAVAGASGATICPRASQAPRRVQAEGRGRRHGREPAYTRGADQQPA